MQTMKAEDLRSGSGQRGVLTSSFDGASNGTSVSAMQAFGTGPLQVAAGIAHQNLGKTDAAAVDSQLDRHDMTGRAGFANLTYEDRMGHRWSGRVYRRVSEVDSSLYSLLGTGRFRSTTALDGDDEQQSDIVSLEYDAEQLGPIDGATIRAYHQSTATLQRTYDERANASRPVAIDRTFSFDQVTRGLEASFVKSMTGVIEHELGFGFDARRRETEEFRDGIETSLVDGTTTRTILGEVFPLRDFPLTTSKELGIYVEDTMHFGRWLVTAALRADRYDMRPRVDPMYAEDYPYAVPVSIRAQEVSPKLGIVGRLSDSAEIYFQYAHGFRAPPYEDANISLDIPLFNLRAVPNPDLRAERSDGFDVGLRWRGERSRAYLSLFRTAYEDFIESRVNIGIDPVSGRLLFQSQNIDRADIEGVEAGVAADLGTIVPGLGLDLRVFAARGEDRRNGEPLNSVGPPQAAVAVDYAPVDSRWQARLRATFTDGWTRRDESGGELFQPPGYGSVDLYLAYKLSAGATLRVGARNLANQTYWSWTDVRNLSPADPTIPQLSQPGRNFSAGLDIRW